MIITNRMMPNQIQNTAFAASTVIRVSTFNTNTISQLASGHRPSQQLSKPTFRPRASIDPPGSPSSPPPPDNEGSEPIRDKQNGPFSAARDFLAGIRRATGLTNQAGIEEDDTFDIDRTRIFPSDDDSPPPEVLVVGATGRTGRIITRKLILRGYKVRVLVRDLYSSTLDLLGTGVSYVKGDLHNYDSLLEAASDVDKVICAIGIGTRDVDYDEGKAESIEYRGVSNLIRAFQDSKVQMYGRAEATKLTLFKFAEEQSLKQWKRVIPESGDNGVQAPRINFQVTSPNRVAFMGQVYSTYTGLAEIRSMPNRINLNGFSGLILRCVGDGKKYYVILRSAKSYKLGYEYIAEFQSFKNKWNSIRIPFSQFKPYSLTDQTLNRNAPELDRNDIRQIAIQYKKPKESPEKDDGKFYLALDYLKTYRTQEQPDFVFVSCASVTSRDFSDLDEHGLRAAANDDLAAWKYLAENRLRQSGLTYCIVRPGQFTDQPGGNKALMLEQDGDVSGAISRADVAEICVKSLLDPRACNVTFDAFESMYAPSALSPQQDVSSMLGRLRPNT